MVKILWAIILIWSLMVFITVLVDWVKWKPEGDNLAQMVGSVFVYRFKMFLKMIIPGILAIGGAFGALL